MIHAAVWWLYAQFLRFIMNLPTKTDSEGRTYTVIENIYIADLVTLSGVIIIVILAHLSYLFVETKFNNLK